jgi:hypothetical protein
MSWWVMLEGHSIGATGHVSGQAARMYDCNSTRQALYQQSANRQVVVTVDDSIGSQSPTSATGVATDVSGSLVAYAATYEPGVAFKVYRNGVLIATDSTVGVSINAWVQAFYFGNRLDLSRALSGWKSAPHFLFGTALTADQIVAQNAAGVSAP